MPTSLHFPKLICRLAIAAIVGGVAGNVGAGLGAGLLMPDIWFKAISAAGYIYILVAYNSHVTIFSAVAIGIPLHLLCQRNKRCGALWYASGGVITAVIGSILFFSDHGEGYVYTNISFQISAWCSLLGGVLGGLAFRMVAVTPKIPVVSGENP